MDEIRIPCPVCRKPIDGKTFCCSKKCHASYMIVQRAKWNEVWIPDFSEVTGPRQHTGHHVVDPEVGAPIPSRPSRPDPGWKTDEQLGSWSYIVRAFEESS